MRPNAINTAIKHLSKDPIMKELIERYGKCDIAPSNDYFTALIRSIISQQLSVKAAGTIYGRFKDLVGIEYTAQDVMKYDTEQIRQIGCSYMKVSFIQSIAEVQLNNPTFFEDLVDKDDMEVLKQLTAIRGVGEWTAQMFMMFRLFRLNILPSGDVGIQNAFQKFYGTKTKPNKVEMIIISKKWEPFRTVACWYLWKGLDNSD